MKISFDVEDDLLSDAIRDAVENCDLDEIAADAIREAVAASLDLDEIAADAMQSRVRDFDENDIITEMIKQMTSREYARGYTAGRDAAGTAVEANQKRAQDLAHDMGDFYRFGETQRGGTLAALIKSNCAPSELLSALESETAGTASASFVSGMLYALHLTKVK